MTDPSSRSGLAPLRWPDPEPAAGSGEACAAVVSCAGLIGGVLLGLSAHWLWLVGGLVVFFGAGSIGLVLAAHRAEPRTQAVEAQLSERGTLPPEQWGNDPVRRGVVRELIDQPWIPWRSRNFIPEDPFRIVLGADLACEFPPEMAIQFLGAALGEELPLWEAELLLKMTLGEVVDHFAVNRARHWLPRRRLPDDGPAPEPPSSGPPSSPARF